METDQLFIDALANLGTRLGRVAKCKSLERTLRSKIKKAELFNRMTVDRELKVIELKNEINALCKKTVSRK